MTPLPDRRRRVEQRRRVGEAELVRRVEIVDGERAADAVAIDPQVQEAEGRRMALDGCGSGEQTHSR